MRTRPDAPHPINNPRRQSECQPCRDPMSIVRFRPRHVLLGNRLNVSRPGAIEDADNKGTSGGSSPGTDLGLHRVCMLTGAWISQRNRSVHLIATMWKSLHVAALLSSLDWYVIRQLSEIGVGSS
jgi:hypothetical protein